MTTLCVGAQLAINIKSVLSPFGATIFLLIVAFHLSTFIASYVFTGLVFHKALDVKELQRTLSYERSSSITDYHQNIVPGNIILWLTDIFHFAGMQSSLLALALANRSFQDPFVSVPPVVLVNPYCCFFYQSFYIFSFKHKTTILVNLLTRSRFLFYFIFIIFYF